MSKIAEMLNISRNNIADYLLYMEEAGMVAQLRDGTGGVRGLGKVEKVYLDNTNLAYGLADFKIDTVDFEVGGKSKGLKQIKTAEKGFVVKDDIESGFLNTIPLWHFGLMY